MSALSGRTVRLFFAEGKALGRVTAEIINWTGHVLAGSRSGLSALLKRTELEDTGIYFLTGLDPEDPETQQVYIGEWESEQVDLQSRPVLRRMFCESRFRKSRASPLGA